VPDAGIETTEDRLADQEMADVELGELRDCGDGHDIVEGQAVAGVGLDAVLHRQCGAVGDTLQLGGAFVAFDMGIAAGVELDDRSAEADRRGDLLLGRFDEQADADVRRAELVDVISEVIVLASRVQAAIGRPFLAALGDDAGRVGTMRQRDRQHLLGRCHFQIQRQVDLGHQAVDVIIRDVPAVFAKMRGDSVGARVGRDVSGANRVRMIAPARVPDRRDVVDIDAEAQPFRHAAARLPGLTAGIAARSGGTESAS